MKIRIKFFDSLKAGQRGCLCDGVQMEQTTTVFLSLFKSSATTVLTAL